MSEKQSEREALVYKIVGLIAVGGIVILSGLLAIVLIYQYYLPYTTQSELVFAPKYANYVLEYMNAK